ncbi:MAG: TylF/MycF/NovP-related O-methyltransferase [Candidatus Saccharimonadales bacterium]
MIEGQQLREMRITLRDEGIAVFQLEAPGDPLHSSPWDAPWLTDPAFSAIHDSMKGSTLVDRNRCYSLYELAGQTRDVPGDVLEVGVWRGGTTALLAQSAPERTVYAADTFTGVVKGSALDPHYKGGEHADTTRELVESLLGDLGVSNVVILEGIYPDDTGTIIADKALSLVHIDVDTHDSAADAFHACGPMFLLEGWWFLMITAFDRLAVE